MGCETWDSKPKFPGLKFRTEISNPKFPGLKFKIEISRSKFVIFKDFFNKYDLIFKISWDDMG